MIPFRKGSELDVSSNSEAVSSAESNSVEIERKFENFAASEPSKEKNNDDPFSDDEQDTISIDPDELVEIDQVLSSRIGDNGRLEFQILWKHDKVSDLITWCERDELSDCINIEVLDEFFEKGASRKRPSRNPKSQSTEIASPIKKRARAIPTKMNKGAVDKIKDASSEDDEDPFSNEEPEEEENGSQFSDDTSDESPFRAERELEDPITDTIERNVHLKSSSSDVLNSDRSPRQYQAHESAKTAASDSAIHHTPEIDYAGWGDLMSSSIPSPPKMKVVSQNVNKTSNSGKLLVKSFVDYELLLIFKFLESSISLLSSPPLSSVQAGMSSSISFRIELPSKDVFEIELSQKLNPFPSLFVGT